MIKPRRISSKDVEITKGMGRDDALKLESTYAAKLTARGCGSTHYVYIAPLNPSNPRGTWAVYVRDRANDSFDMS